MNAPRATPDDLPQTAQQLTGELAEAHLGWRTRRLYGFFDRDSDPEHAAARGQASQRLRAAVATLPERERKVAVLLYVYHLTLREIGEVLGVTESRVCQIHAQILRTLHTQLAAHEQLFLAATAA